jgi:hypothetical protein
MPTTTRRSKPANDCGVVLKLRARQPASSIVPPHQNIGSFDRSLEEVIFACSGKKRLVVVAADSEVESCKSLDIRRSKIENGIGTPGAKVRAAI